MNQLIFDQMQKINGKVRALLEQYEELRDDDYKLIATFYYYEAGGSEALKRKSALEFLDEFSKKKYSHSESIRRVRAKIQEENEHLRGKIYRYRQMEGENFKYKI